MNSRYLSSLTRRRFFRLGGAGVVSMVTVSLLSGCIQQTLSTMRTPKWGHSTLTWRLRSRPMQPTETGTPGLHPLGLEPHRDGFLYVPTSYHADYPSPLILMLHGAGGDAEGGLRILQDLAEQFGVILLAIDSRDKTWDVIMGQYGPDIAFMDRALSFTFSRYAIDPDHVAIAGFSDGASYALSVGISNGDVFPQIVAFSPGFMTPVEQIGEPQIFISHGKRDTVLPIDRCSRRIAPSLQQVGYTVHYQEFDGAHTVPEAIAHTAMRWFMDAPPNEV